MTKTYKVEGMHCGGCTSSVENAIRTAVPGADVTVQLEGGLVIVEGVVDDSLIRQAVEDAGFTYSGAV